MKTVDDIIKSKSLSTLKLLATTLLSQDDRFRDGDESYEDFVMRVVQPEVLISMIKYNKTITCKFKVFGVQYSITKEDVSLEEALLLVYLYVQLEY